MKLDQFKKRTSNLKEIYDLFEKVVKKCDACSKLRDKPCRSRISGLRAETLEALFLLIMAKSNSMPQMRILAKKSPIHFSLS